MHLGRGEFGPFWDQVQEEFFRQTDKTLKHLDAKFSSLASRRKTAETTAQTLQERLLDDWNSDLNKKEVSDKDRQNKQQRD